MISARQGKRVWLVIIILTVILNLPVWSQNGDKTIEELYLQTAIKTQIIKAEAYSDDRDMKLIALQDIEQLIEDGTAEANAEELVQILSDLGKEGVARRVSEGGAVINDFPMIRREACRLLGEMGGTQAQETLQTVLLSDPEPMVMSEAILALAKTGLDEEGEVTQTMANAMYKQTAYLKSNSFAYNYLVSIEILSQDGIIKDPLVFEEITKIANPRNGYDKIVRQKALTLLKDLQDI